MKKTLKPEIDIPWNKDMVKRFLWRPIQKATIGSESTTDMNTIDPSQIYEVLNRHLADKFGISVPWPSESHEEKKP